jgi:hypothetical protein
MFVRSRRPVMMLGSALLALLFAAQPAAAATVISQSGTIGTYQFQDNQNTTRGADCVYATNGSPGEHKLKTLKIRGPKIFAYNDHSGTKQYVGWKFLVQSEPVSATDAFTTFFSSSVVKERVNVSAGFQFGSRNWTAPGNVTSNTNWRVVVVLFWYKRSGSTTVQGKLTASYDYYHVKGGGSTPNQIRQTDCNGTN